MKFHPYADLFPMMTEEELAALTADIKAHGLRQAIVRYQGKVLDGRNRLLACEKAGVKPRFEDFDGDDRAAFALVISANVQRRELTAGQRAVVAARVLEKLGGEWGGNRKSSAGSRHLNRDDVAKAFKVNREYVQHARALLAEAPDLAEQVAAGALPLEKGYALLLSRRGGEKAVDEAILARFDTANEVEKFSEAVRKNKIPKERHGEIADVVLDKQFNQDGKKVRTHGDNMARAVEEWWYVESGEAGREVEREAKEAAFRTFDRRYRGGDLGSYLLDVGQKVRDLQRVVKDVLPVAKFYDNQKHRDNLVVDLAALEEVSARLRADLTGPPVRPDDDPGGHYGRPGGTVIDNEEVDRSPAPRTPER
jgi:hypothetical protein